ncbi:hypothetical protein B0H19DRAFT_1084452 [Mycena capillaripes]|nr:hypothetical protein B0H19DRAFT_1084452 [Mycena capillaripes]
MTHPNVKQMGGRGRSAQFVILHPSAPGLAQAPRPSSRSPHPLSPFKAKHEAHTGTTQRGEKDVRLCIAKRMKTGKGDTGKPFHTADAQSERTLCIAGDAEQEYAGKALGSTLSYISFPTSCTLKISRRTGTRDVSQHRIRPSYSALAIRVAKKDTHPQPVGCEHRPSPNRHSLSAFYPHPPLAHGGKCGSPRICDRETKAGAERRKTKEARTASCVVRCESRAGKKKTPIHLQPAHEEVGLLLYERKQVGRGGGGGDVTSVTEGVDANLGHALLLRGFEQRIKARLLNCEALATKKKIHFEDRRGPAYVGEHFSGPGAAAAWRKSRYFGFAEET